MDSSFTPGFIRSSFFCVWNAFLSNKASVFYTYVQRAIDNIETHKFTLTAFEIFCESRILAEKLVSLSTSALPRALSKLAQAWLFVTEPRYKYAELGRRLAGANWSCSRRSRLEAWTSSTPGTSHSFQNDFAFESPGHFCSAPLQAGIRQQ